MAVCTRVLALQEMQEHLRQQPALLPEILHSLFEIILFEENSNQWSLSRPMLSLILINEPVSEAFWYVSHNMLHVTLCDTNKHIVCLRRTATSGASADPCPA
jgi:hypothetical protein